MANTRISDLTASASNLAASDLVPVVQTPGVGPVKMTGTQIKTGIIGAGSVSIASGKTFTASNTLTLAGTDSTTMTFPSTSATIARTDAGNTFTGNQVITEAVGGSGLTITGATQTTSQPVLNLTQTWNAGAVTFTGLRFNATDTASAAGSRLLDLQVGGASKFRVTKGVANVQFAKTTDVLPSLSGTNNSTTLVMGDGGSYLVSQEGTNMAVVTPGGSFAVIGSDKSLYASMGQGGFGLGQGGGSTAVDTILSRAAAATLQLGAADAAAPVAQTFKVQGVVAGTSNTAGANFTIRGSQGTGTGAGGSIIFQVAPAGSSGTAQNAFTDALSISSAGVFRFNGGNAVIKNGDSNNLYIGNNGSGSTSQYGISIRPLNNEAGLRVSFGIALGATSQDGAQDTFIYRDAANTLALRNGTSAQRFNVYNTYTSSTNYETFKIDWITTANTCLIGTEKGSGGGTARALEFQTDGTTRLTIGAAGAITQTAGTLADGANAYSLTATMPASQTGVMTGVNFSVTGAGSSIYPQTAVNINLNAGYTGASLTNALAAVNLSAGTSNAYGAGSSSSGYRPFGNRGFNLAATGVTTGINTGVVGQTANSTTANYGVWGSATFAVNSSWNVGVAGFGLNTGTGTQEIGGFFALYDGGTSAPNLVSAALVADNGTSSNPIFLARDNASTVFSIANGGVVAFGATASASVPALKPSSTTLQVRLGDDTALTNIEALNLTNGRTIQKFTPLDNQPPASNFATLDTRNSIAVLDFDDTTAESAVFVGVISAGAILTSGISVRIHWMATSATSGDCRWSVAFEDMNTDLDTDSFDTATAGNSAANGTSGVPSTLTLTCTTIDSLVAGDFFRIKVTRDAANGGDTMTGDAELIAVEIRQVA